MLLSMSADDPGRYQLKKKQLNYEKMIAHGAMGEAGKNHYIFIYRDIVTKQDTYAGILFLYNPFDLKKPVTYSFKGPDSLRDHWNLYLGAAIHFLRKNYQNTMMVLATGAVRELYDELKQTADAHEQGEEEKYEKFRQFDFNLLEQDVQVRELELDIPPDERDDPNLEEKLELLEPGRKKTGTVGGKQSPARLGLCLMVSGLYKKSARFQPMIVPIKKDGSSGAVRPAILSLMAKYRFDPIPPLLQEFTRRLHDLTAKSEKSPAKYQAISDIYFEGLANLSKEMPEEQVFYQLDGADNKFHPLAVSRFRKAEICFAPAHHGGTLSISPVLTGEDDQILDIRGEYDIFFKEGERFYLFFKTGEDRACLAFPIAPGKLYHPFHFISEMKIVNISQFRRVVAALQKSASGSFRVNPEPLPVYSLKFRPTPVLRMKERDKLKKKPQRIEVDFDYRSEFSNLLIENSHIRLARYEEDKEFESNCLHLLRSDPLLDLRFERSRRGRGELDVYYIYSDGDQMNWLMESGPRYLSRGFKIFSSRQGMFIGKTDSTVRIDISPGLKWLEFRPLLQNAATGETFEIAHIDFHNSAITDKNGTLHIIKKEDNDQLIKLSQFAQRAGKAYRVPSRNYYLINFLYHQRMAAVPEVKDSLASARKLEAFEKVPKYPLSRNINGKLRKYQEAGYRWLRFLHEYELSGCLADDMGLGKTLQTLSLLQSLDDAGQLTTSLLVVPVSAIPNWEAEVEKFTPDLTVYRHMGPGRKKDAGVWRQYNLVITSYATLRIDIALFQEFQFDYIVLDESQAIKNHNSQVTKAVKVVNGKHRLALSGTPIENTSMELWSLMDFLMPGFLGSPEWFNREWALPVEKHKNSPKTELLKKMIYPFVLRRKKEHVEKDLPEKIEIVERLNMDEEQLTLYASTAKYYSDVITEAIDQEGLAKSSFKIIEGMLRLRQICLFPALVDEQYAGVSSVKYGHFTEMLEDILAEGHKVLLFSQFVRVLDFLKAYFDELGIRYSYIDGSVPVKKRGEAVNAFQEDDQIPVFLLSLKAGGVALNLTAADYVIIFDPWWNPAVEAQAIDRSHRIGQTRKVMVYRMVVKDTIEEKMLALQEQKKELVDKLITSETTVFKDLTRDDIMSLFRFR